MGPDRFVENLVPDTPRWIDLKGLLHSGRCDIWAEARPADGFVAMSWDFPFAALYGDPRPDLVQAATAAGLAACTRRYPVDEWQLLASPEARAVVESALPGWKRRGIVLHRWAGKRELPPPDADVEISLLPRGLAESELALDAFPAATRQELAVEWVSRRPMAVASVEEQLVTCCYAAFTTESLWDVSIETLELYRRRGLAATCFQYLAAHMADRGKTPAWGADLDNPASLGLAAKLGFVRDATIDGWFEDQKRVLEHSGR